MRLLNARFCSLSGWVRSFGRRTRQSLRLGASVTAELDSGSGGDIIVPSSLFFPSVTATLDVIRIDPRAFANILITSVTILRHVQFIDSLAFSNVLTISISIASDNLHFVMKSYFILDSSRKNLILHLGDEWHIAIPCHVQILCSSCFSLCNPVSSISFESHSELTPVESDACSSYSSLKSITIPRHVQILCSPCFASCESLSSISFEANSELTRIESNAFFLVLLSHQSQFLVMFKFCVHRVFHIGAANPLFIQAK
jgi:hypothetical protein